VRILVTGSSGLIGSHTARALVKQGHDVYGISRSNNNPVKGETRFNVDLRDKAKTEEIITKIRPKVVYHFAANAAEGKAQFSPIDITERNINIFLNTLVPAINAGMKRFIFTSSIAVYGSIEIPFKESDPPIPQDIYGINKLACERTLRVLSKVHEFEYVIARPHNVYGPGQNMTDPYRNVVTLFMNSLLKGEAYSIFGDGTMRRCFSYIDDVVDVLTQLKEGDINGLTVNVGSEKTHTINELSDMIKKVSGIDIEPKYLPDRPQEVHTAKSDHSLCRSLFGYKDTAFKKGISETWKWCKKQGPQEHKHTQIEIPSKKLPSTWKNQS
jgi:UDP-glucose 4-epimerase